MPISYKMKCLENPNLISSSQGCYSQRKAPSPFTPSNRPVIHTFKEKQTPFIPVNKIQPVGVIPTTINPLPTQVMRNHLINIETEHFNNQDKSQDNNEEDLGSKVKSKISFFSEELRQQHLNFIKTLENHPNFQPIDKVAAHFASAAYLPDDEIAAYLEENGLANEWKLHPDENTHNEWIKSFVNEEGEIIIAGRGTKTWLKDDGIANVSNSVGTTEIRQRLLDNTDIDIRTTKARAIDNTHKYIQSTGEEVLANVGHSQSAFDSVRAQKLYHPNSEVIVFNPAPNGIPLKSQGRAYATPNDVVSLTNKVKAKLDPLNYEVNIVKSIDKSALNIGTAGHSITNFTMDEAPYKPVKFAGIKNIGRAGFVGLAGVAGDEIVEAIAPQQPEIAKTVEKSVLGAGLMNKASLMVGAPTMATAELVVPLALSYEATELTTAGVGSLLDKTDLGEEAKGTLSGASGGAVGAATFNTSAAAVVKTGQLAGRGIQAIRGVQAVGEVAEGTELVPLLTTAGEATEVAEVAAGAFEVGEAALLTAEIAETAIITTEAVGIGAAAATGAAAGSFLAPETLGVSILIGAGIGALGGLIGGMMSHSADEERRKEEEIQETERKRLWAIEEQTRYDKAVADYHETLRVEAIKTNQSVWLGQHKYNGAKTYHEAFTTYTAQQELEETAASQENTDKPFVLQQEAS